MKAKVIWLSGNLTDRKLTLAQLKGELSSKDVLVLQGSYTVAYLEQLVRQEFVFSDDKVIIIRDMPTISSNRPTMVNQLKKLLEEMPDDCTLIFDGVGEEKAIQTHISKIGKVFAFPETVEPHLAVNWLVDVFTEHGKEISEADAQLLIETSGHDPSVGGLGIDLLRLSALKVALYLGRRKNVTRDDIQANIFPSEEVVIWSILDAIDSKDLVSCYNAFTKLVEKEGSVVSAVNLLYNIALPRYRLLMFVKEGMAQNKSKQDIAKEAMLLPKLSQSGKDWQMVMSPEIADGGVNAGQPKKMFAEFAVNSALFGGFGSKAATVDLYSRKDVVRIVNCLESGLPELRARSVSEPAMAILADILFLAVCTQVDDKILIDLRTPYNYL